MLFYHNLVITFRNFKRSKKSFLINLIGLTSGLACTLLIYLWVASEWSMDGFHQKSERLYQVMEHQAYAEDIMTTISTPGILSGALKEEIPEVEHAVTTSWPQSFTLSFNDKNIKADGLHVGEDFFNIFTFPLIEGDAGQVMKDKMSIVLSASLADRFFGNAAEAVGKQLTLNHDASFLVSGVFEDMPKASSIQTEFVLTFEYFKDDNEWVNYWGNNGPPTFLTLKEGADEAAVNEKIADFIVKKNEDSNVTLFLKPFAERYLYGRYENGVQSGGRIVYVKLFSIIAGFILVIACINFMNLSTAQASKRVKEVGIKKALGAQKGSMITQFLSESMTIAFVALIAALLLVWLFLPVFNEITDKSIEFTLSLDFVLAASAITVVTGLLAGSYPALYLSGFTPTTVLKTEVKGSWGELWVRKGLVIFQFALSVILIVSVMVIYKQIEFVQNKNLGYNRNNVVKLALEGKAAESVATFMEEVKRVPGVVSASTFGHNLIGRQNNTSGLKWEGKDPESLILFENVRVNHDALDLLGIEMVAGRKFSRDFPADTGKIIFNEAAIKVMGLEDPLGKVIDMWGRHKLEIIGVAKDFHFQSLHDQVEPLFFMLRPEQTWQAFIRIEEGKEKETLAALSQFYQTFNPGFVFDYEFMDVQYQRLYADEQRVATLSQYFAGFAILISCLGLFGLAMFTAERRLKELGIRKILGASPVGLVLLITQDFTRMVSISIVVALPLSFWLINNWLERFAYHIDLSPWFFVLAAVAALLITWLTVGYQAVKAASVNPTKCLRSE